MPLYVYLIVLREDSVKYSKMQNSPVSIHGLIMLFEVYPTWFVIIVKFKAGVLARYKGSWEDYLV